MWKPCLAMLALVLVVRPAKANDEQYPKAKVSFDDFKHLVGEVEPHRRERLVDFDTFLKMSQQPGVVILDTRSTFRYERIHVKGAKHLSFTDFTQENLAKVVPSQETTILIYCNNNFDGNQVDFATKVAGIPKPGAKVVSPGAARTFTSQLASQEKPLMLALNVPTYITLYGYGYRNIYELDELVKVTDRRVEFEGTIVEARSANPLPKLQQAK